MDCFEAIRNRRSVRSYLPDAVTPEDIQTLLEAANMAPSARNLQPWRFFVYLDRARLEDLGREIKQWIFHLPIDEPFASPMHKVLNDPAYNVFYGAPALVLVVAADMTNEAAQDCCMAAQNAMLAARALNLGSTWVGAAKPWFNLESAKQSMGIPETCRVVAPIVVGHPTAWPTAPERHPPKIRWCRVSDSQAK